MPYHEHISIVLDNTYGICEVLTLLDRCSLRLCKSEGGPAEPRHRRLKAQLCTRARFVEQGRHYLPMKHVRPSLHERLHDLRHVQNLVDLRPGKVTNGDNISASKVRCGRHANY